MCERDDLWFDALLVVWVEVLVGGGTKDMNEKGHRFPIHPNPKEKMGRGTRRFTRVEHERVQGRFVSFHGNI